ncbi:MAG: hypothetical protein ABSE48_17920 [Verrucomicrobiota bacterium]
MLETLSILPLSFWVVIVLLGVGAILAVGQIKDGTGLPMLVVLSTVTAWYVGDAFYNDYASNHAKIFTPDILSSAWWQVAWFVLVLVLITPVVHEWFNHAYRQRSSGVLQIFKHGIEQPTIQRQLNAVFSGCAAVWIVLFAVALLVLKDQVIYYIFPFLGYNASPWMHGRIGAGFDCFSILGEYLQLLSATMFGVVAALATNRKVRCYALVLCVLAWPFFIFGRTRNTMLAMVVPAILCWVFLRLRGGMWKKVIVLLTCFFVINFWMKFIIANRSQTTITAAFHEKGLDLAAQKKVHNEGLNMYEELCWISTFIDDGRYHVNWGERYFAELVNPIPRGLWHGKPLIGIDYAIARGQGGGSADGAGVNATISTGMIGQGVVNFGRILGPAFAALLMSFWIAWLARLDLQVTEFGRLPLYALGIILTFNLGRDITLITLYPFVFGALLIWWIDSRRSHSTSPQASQRTQPKATMTPTHKESLLAWKNRPKKPTFSLIKKRQAFDSKRVV